MRVRTHDTLFLAALLAVTLNASPSPSASDPGLAAFRAWLQASHPGYRCDEGPSPFKNRTVEAAYPGQRLYYVLTYARGIPPPFPNGTSVVALVDDENRVLPYRAPASYGRGLIRVSSSKTARLAAAAVSIVASCDPGERRWHYDPERFKVKKSSRGWKATYRYEPIYTSWVMFDRNGGVLELGGSAPPVP